MKYIGIDYGTKRIGVAVSDEDGSFAFPKEIVPSAQIFEYLIEIVKKENISGIVIGESLASNGLENDVVLETRLFAKKLESKIPVPLFFEREGYSTVEAHRYQTKKGNRDDSAAAVILQRFLDKQKK